MNERELLEMAAKAACHEFKWDQSRGSKSSRLRILVGDRWVVWDPLTDDGHALRLAVKLNLLIDCYSTCARPLPDSAGWSYGEQAGADQFASTRRAIVLTAAEIGRSMP